MLDRNRAILIVTDIQGKLAGLMNDRESFIRNAGILIDGARILGVPILWVEQYPEGLGATIPEIASLLHGLSPLPKRTFSALRDDVILAAFTRFARDQIIIAGIETHVCVYQTALDTLARGMEVFIPEDAVSSRTARDRRTGLDMIVHAGGHPACVESILFELLGTAEDKAFRQISGLVK